MHAHPLHCSLTFLATLFVLLFVSCAIVLRSFVLRRRFRQQLEEQIAAGILPPEALWNYRKRDFGEKPKLYDVGVFPSAQVESWTSISVSAAFARWASVLAAFAFPEQP